MKEIDGYAIYRDDKESGEYSKIASVGKDTTEYTDNNCTPNTKYSYQIMTYKWNGTKYVYSKPVYVSTVTLGYAPDKVENIHVYNTTGNSIWLDWDSDWENYADGYVVYRSDTEDGVYDKVETVTGGKTSFADNNIEHNKTYYYYVRGYKKVDDNYYYSPISEIYSYTINLSLDKPNNVRIYNTTNNSQWLGWNEVKNSDGYIVYRAEAEDGKYNRIGTVTGGKTSYADYNIEHGKTYYYYIKAYIEENGHIYEGEPSNVCKYKTNVMPGETRNVRIYKESVGSQWLGWDEATKTTGYVVYRKEGTQKEYEKVATVTGGKTSWADYNLKHGKTYYYYVRAYNGVNGKYYYGVASNVCGHTSNFIPGETSGLRIYNATESSRWLGWDEATKTTGYVVYRKEGTQKEYEKVATVTGGKTSWADYGITYQYYVRAYAGVNGSYYYGKISNIITVTVK